MRTERSFEVHCDRDHAVEVVGREATLLSLLSDGKAEIVERRGDRTTVRVHYSALGREGVATFHFDQLMDGSVRFEKVCDGKVWRELRGHFDFAEAGAACRVTLELEGRTQGLVPEFTIRGPMEEQVDQMADALRRKLEE